MVSLNIGKGFIRKNIVCEKKRTKFGGIYMECYTHHNKGKNACSWYNVVSTYEDKYGNTYSLVQVRIFTGRTHQIRVHMKSIGHPLVSDQKYLTRNWYEANKKLSNRLCLHNFYLSFKHDANEYRIRIPMSCDLINTISKLDPIEKYDYHMNLDPEICEIQCYESKSKQRSKIRSKVKSKVKSKVRSPSKTKSKNKVENKVEN